MNNQHFVVLFHQVNYPLATRMTRHLVQAGFTFALLCEDDLKPGESLAQRLEQDTRPLLLMVSDNFLKDAACVAQLLPTLQQREPGEIQIIVLTEGFPDQAHEPVPTRLDRVGQILHYINYWQDQYLQMRKIRPDQITDPQGHDLKIKQVRKIAFEIGNLIEFLREQQTYSWEALTANHYELFFRKSGNISLHEDFKREHPFLEEDEHLEERIRESMTIFQDEHDRMVEATDHLTESLSELVTADSPRSDESTGGQEHDLLKKLIAYKNGLEEESPEEEEDDDDDWDEDESSEADSFFSDDPFPLDTEQGGHIIPLPSRDQAHLKRLVENDPENIPARLDLAAMLAEDDQYFNETTQHLEEVLRLDPKNARAFALLGQLSERYHEHKLAIRYFEKALESDPTFGPAHLGLGQILLTIDGQEDRAIDHLSEARSLMPDHAHVWETYGQALLDHGRLKKAAKAFKKVLKLDPERKDIKAKIADIYYQLGDRIKAVQYHRDTVDEPMQTDTGWPEEPDYPHTIEAIPAFDMPAGGDRELFGERRRVDAGLRQARELRCAFAHLGHRARSGRELVGIQRLDRVDHAHGRLFGVDGGLHLLQVDLGQHAHGRGAQPQPVCAQCHLGAADVERLRLPRQAVQRLQQQGALADAGVAADQHHAAGHQAAAEHAVKFIDAGRQAFHLGGFDRRERGHRLRPGQRLEAVAGAAGGLGHRLHQGVPGLALRALAQPARGVAAALAADVNVLLLGHP